MKRTHRVKVIRISHKCNLNAIEMRQLLDQLPPDVEFINANQDWNTHTWGLIVSSSSFPEIGEAEILPEFTPVFQAPQANPTQPKRQRCTCGADYTGSRHMGWCDLERA